MSLVSLNWFIDFLAMLKKFFFETPILTVYIFVQLPFLVSLILLGYNIWARHELLAKTIGTRSEENDAYYRSFHLLIGGTLAVLISSSLEMVFYFLLLRS